MSRDLTARPLPSPGIAFEAAPEVEKPPADLWAPWSLEGFAGYQPHKKRPRSINLRGFVFVVAVEAEIS
jgi:hypothetical protein